MSEKAAGGRTRRWPKALGRPLFPGGRRGTAISLGVVIVLIGALYAPATLAFPHRAQYGETTVYSVAPIPAVMADRIHRADELLVSSPLFEPGVGRTVVLTDGGWRWRVMAVGYSGAVALRRPFSSVLLFNRTDIVGDRVRNNAPIGGQRTLSGTIAHETVHLLTARRYGEIKLVRMPRWKREGYADYIARETSLRADDERRIRARSPNASVLEYYEGRRRVAARLARNGNSIEELFSEAP